MFVALSIRHFSRFHSIFRIRTFCYGSGSSNPYHHRFKDLDLDTFFALFFRGFKDVNKKKVFSQVFLPLLLHTEIHLQQSSEITSYLGNQGFSKFVCLVIEGSGSVEIVTDPNPGDLKNFRIRNPGSNSVIRSFVISLGMIDIHIFCDLLQEKNHQCPLCPLSVYKKNTLKRHLEWHNKGKVG
jgi:hypothetical protein